jgi:hypothetical protein
MVQVSTNPKGTHSMQSLISKVCTEEEQLAIRDGLLTSVLKLAYDNNGTHVLQKVILTLEEQNLDFVFESISRDFVNLSLNANGLSVVSPNDYLD